MFELCVQIVAPLFRKCDIRAIREKNRQTNRQTKQTKGYGLSLCFRFNTRIL